MEPKSIARLESIAQRTWLRFFDNRLGLSKDELARMTEAELKSDVLPAMENLLADKPSHIVPWGENLPFVQADDARNIWGFDMKLSSCMYNYGELHNLSIKAGTLTEEERFKINDHIVQTICMLSSLPFPKELSRVMDIAGNHHEHMNGFGYPRKLTEKEMSIPERVLVLADIFEALTAHDRPYKEAKTLTQALSILSRMAKEGRLDKDIFNLFLQSGAYMAYAKEYLSPEQVDDVRIEDFLV